MPKEAVEVVITLAHLLVYVSEKSNFRTVAVDEISQQTDHNSNADLDVNLN